MGVYDRIKSLCEQNGTTVTALEKALGFGRGSIGKLKDNRKPSYERVQKIAAYFGVPVEYLYGGDGVQKNGQVDGYYVYGETAEVAQEIFENSDMRILFDAARNSRPEDLRRAADLLQRFKETNPDG